jgi:hypothetical protein
MGLLGEVEMQNQAAGVFQTVQFDGKHWLSPAALNRFLWPVRVTFGNVSYIDSTPKMGIMDGPI